MNSIVRGIINFLIGVISGTEEHRDHQDGTASVEQEVDSPAAFIRLFVDALRLPAPLRGPGDLKPPQDLDP